MSAAMLAAHYYPAVSPMAAAISAALTIPWLIMLVISFWRKGRIVISRDLCAIIVIFLLCTSAGFLRSWVHYEHTVSYADKYSGRTMQAHFVIRDYPLHGNNYSSVQAWYYPSDGGKRVSVLISDYDYFQKNDVRPGDRIEAEVKFSSALTSMGKATDNYTAKGIYLRATLKEVVNVSCGANGVLHAPKLAAYKVKQSCMEAFPQDVASFMTALLTGDKTELSRQEDVYSNIRDSGISHMIAVSGMHVAFLLGALMIITRRSRKTAFIGIPVILFFMAMTGFTPSVVRAGVMQILILIAPLFGRETDAPTTLAFAGIVVLMPNPDAIAGVSFQLSFAAVSGMLLLCPYLSQKYEDIVSSRKFFVSKALDNAVLRSIYAAAAGTIGALCFTLPISAIHFGSFSLYGLITNLLTVWAVSVSFVLGYIVCIMHMLIPAAGCLVGTVTGFLPRYILSVAEFISSLPGAVVYTKGNILSWAIAFCYLLVILSALLSEKRKWTPSVPLSCCVVMICVSIAASKFLSVNEPLIAAINVGQGQSIAVLEKNATVVIDCGNIYSSENAGDITASYLASKGRNQIDVLMLSHLHSDHASGVMRLLSREKVGKIIMPDYPEEYRDELWYGIIEKAEKKHIEIEMVSGEYLLETPQMKYRIFSASGEDENDIGLIFLGSAGDFDFLVTGDAQQNTEMDFIADNFLPDIELYIAGHHGSKYSTSPQLLRTLRPECCFISVGYNTYGHPASETLENLENHNVSWYTTIENGTLEMSIPAKFNNTFWSN